MFETCGESTYRDTCGRTPRAGSVIRTAVPHHHGILGPDVNIAVVVRRARVCCAACRESAGAWSEMVRSFVMLR